MISQIINKNLISLSLFFITIVGSYFYINYYPNNSGSIDLGTYKIPDDSLFSLIKGKTTYVVSGYILKEINNNFSTSTKQYEMDVWSASQPNLKGKLIISLKSDSKIDGAHRNRIVIYDSKNDWYDGALFQDNINDYYFNGTVLEKNRNIHMGLVDYYYYRVYVEQNDWESRRPGYFDFYTVDSKIILEKGKKYSFTTTYDSATKKHIIINAGEPRYPIYD